jgi:antitoxin VapB
MALHIEHPEVDHLAQELAERTGETVPEAVVNALRERLQRERGRTVGEPGLREKILAIGARCASLPILDARSPEEILGYDEQGLPR